MNHAIHPKENRDLIKCKIYLKINEIRFESLSLKGHLEGELAV